MTDVSGSEYVMVPVTDERALPNIARASIAHGLTYKKPLEPQLKQFGGLLVDPGASFVTLKLNGVLRGCVGSAEPHRPLVHDVAHNAHAAAFGDTRFPPLSSNEFDRLTLGISILGPLSSIDASDEADLIAQLVPGKDGLVLTDKGRRGLYLPQVWEMLPDPRNFVAHLKVKAGLPQDCWSSTLLVQRFHVHSVGDPGV